MPHPLMLEELLDELAFCPADAAMVGDTEYDLAMAAAMGVAAVAVTWGAHDAERLRRHQPQRIIDRLPQLLDWSLAAQIGRASCRERVWGLAGSVASEIDSDGWLRVEEHGHA